MLVVGGDLSSELGQGKFSKWLLEIKRKGYAWTEDDECVKSKTRDLEEKKSCISNDEHIIALAQVSGARLLYTKDKNLQKDFKNPSLIGNSRGKIYPTGLSKNAKRDRKNLMSRSDICQI